MKNVVSPGRRFSITVAAGLAGIVAVIAAPRAVAQRAVQVEMALINDLEADGPAEEMKNQLRGQLSVELGFIRRTCHPTPEQKEEILAVAEECLTVVAAAKQKAQPRQAGGRFIVRNGRIQEPGGEVSLRHELKKGLRDVLEKDQWERYQEEYEQREAFRKSVLVDQMMASYEKHLGLTVEQQKEIRNSLESDWHPSEHVAFETLRSNPQFLPQIPDRLVLPFLDKDQKTVYQAAPKLNLEQQFAAAEPAVFKEDFWELPE